MISVIDLAISNKGLGWQEEEEEEVCCCVAGKAKQAVHAGVQAHTQFHE